MASFKDSAGREWFIRIHTTAVETVKEKTGLNVLDLFSGELQKQLAQDEMLFFRLIWSLIESQATAAGVSKEQFSEAMLGDEFDRAADAMNESLVDFRRDPEARANLREALRLSKEAQAKAHAITAKRIKGVNIDEWAEEAVRLAESDAKERLRAAKSSSISAINSPESSESIPAR